MCDVIIHTAALTDLAWHFPGIHTTPFNMAVDALWINVKPI